jgi:hypothetical protein
VEHEGIVGIGAMAHTNFLLSSVHIDLLYKEDNQGEKGVPHPFGDAPKGGCPNAG